MTSQAVPPSSSDQPSDQSSHSLTHLIERYEVSLVTLISAVLLGGTTALLGVWELGETAHADLLAWMWSHETWMQVNQPTSATQARAVSELAVGWWPSLISMYSLPEWISPEMRLRLPFVLIGGACAGSMYALSMTWLRSRFIAMTSTAFLLITPAFAIGGRHMLASGGLGAWFSVLATLALLNGELNKRGRGWLSLGVCAWVMSAGSLGVVGLICPLLIWVGAIAQRAQRARISGESITQRVGVSSVALVMGLTAIGLIYWRSWVKRASGVDIWSLYISIDPLTEVYRYEKWAGFQNMMHLIGFGLFPLGAFLPVAFQSLRSRDERPLTLSDAPSDATSSDSDSGVQVGGLLSLSFILSFFSAVLLAPQSGYWGGASALLSAPLAIGVAIFIHDGLARRRALPLYLLAVILFWILIDSDLKRDPGLILSALSGADPKGLLPDLAHWRWARLLTLGGIGWILVYHTSLSQRAINALGSWYRRPMRDPIHLHPALLIAATLGGLGCLLPQTLSLIPRWVVANAFTTAAFWGSASMFTRLTTLTVIGVIGAYWLAHLIWRSLTYARLSVASRQRALLEWAIALSLLIISPHYLGRLPVWRFMRGLLGWMETPKDGPLYLHVLIVHLWVIVALWAILLGFNRLLERQRLISTPSPTPQHLHDKLQGDAPSTSRPSIGVWLRERSSQIGLWLGRALIWAQSAPVGRATLVMWLGAALVFHQVSLPQALSAQLSHHDLVKRYQRFTTRGEKPDLYLVRPEQRGFYLRDLKELTRGQFQESARATDRTFFMVERDQLSKANKHFREVTERHLPILDDQHHKLILASNQLLDGEEDRNPIKRAVISALPTGVTKPKEPINFEDQVELVGWKMTPPSPRPGVSVKLEMFWRVKRKVRSDWKVFVHIDAPGQRIHGDHDPVAGIYPMRDWHKDDLIADEHHIKVSRTIKPATFTFFTGLYRGKTRMKIKNTSSALKDKENRAKVGRVRVR